MDQALNNYPEEDREACPHDNWDNGRTQFGSQGGSIQKVWRCPSADHQDVFFNGLSLESIRKGNYAANFGGGKFVHAAHNGENPDRNLLGAFGTVPIDKYPRGNRLGKGSKIADLADGTSNTLFIGEVLNWDAVESDGANRDQRGVWILPGPGANTFTAWTGPNSATPDQLPQLSSTNTGCAPSIPAGHRMKCTGAPPPFCDTWAAARSAHTGGVNTAMGDGSVRFFRDDIQLATWRALATRAAGDVPGPDF
jgi:prepilin-type processing-associated H-X9-DG protein